MRTIGVSKNNKLLSFILVLMLIFAFTVRYYNLNFNTTFLDEAFYIVRGLRILDGNFKEVIGDLSWIGGFTFFYPLISGILYSIGGILLTRYFNVILGTLAVYFTYLFTKQLKLFKLDQANKTAGLIAASFMAFSSIPVAASRLANYDSLSFTLFLGGLILLQRANSSSKNYYYLHSAVVLFLSFLAKYTVAIYFPLLILLPVYIAQKAESRKKAWLILIYFCLPLLLLTAFYFFLYYPPLLQFLVNQTLLEGTNLLEIIQIFWQYTWVSYLITFVGSIYLWKKIKTSIVILFLFSILPLIVHLATANSATVAQHTYFTFIFLFPILGLFFTSIIQKYFKLGILIITLVTLFNFYYSQLQINEMQYFWPNSQQAVKVLKEKVNADDQILAEGSDIITLALYDQVSPNHITGPFYFAYQDLEGTSAYSLAIKNGYFDYIQLESSYFSSENLQTVKDSLIGKYSEIFNDGKIVIYKLNS